MLKSTQRNLFGKTIVGQKRERFYESQNVPFSFTVDVNSVPSSSLLPNTNTNTASSSSSSTTTAAGVFITLPDTYLFCNVPEEVSAAMVTDITVSFRRSNSEGSTNTNATAEVTKKTQKALEEASAAKDVINLNVYVLDSNRKAQSRPITVATVPIVGASFTAVPAAIAGSGNNASSSSPSLLALSSAKVNIPIGSKTSLMLSPSVASEKLLAKVNAALSSCLAAALGDSDAAGRLTVTIGGYIIDEEAEEEADAEASSAVAITAEGEKKITPTGSVHVKRLLIKMGRQSNLTA